MLPYLLRHSRALLLLSLIVGAFMIAGGIYMLVDESTTVYIDRYGIGEVPDAPVGWISIGMALFLLAGPFLMARKQLAAGPVIGADKTGIYVRPSLDAKRTQYLPWDQVRLIAVRKMNGPNLCVCPVDQSLETPFTVANSSPKGHSAGQKAGQAIAQKRRMKRLETNIFVPLGGADKSPAEILEALRQWSADAVPIRA